MDPKSFKGEYVKLHPRKIDQIWTRHPKMLLRYLKIAVLALFDPITPHIQPIFQHEDQSPRVWPREVARPRWPYLSAHVAFMTSASTRQRGQPSFHRPIYYDIFFQLSGKLCPIKNS